MKDAFKNASWIWKDARYGEDEYAEFIFEFSASEKDCVTLSLASDSNYNVLLNGETVAFGQYADFPEYKVYDTLDLSGKVKAENKVSVIVWYFGRDTQTYIKDAPGVIFELKVNGKEILSSNENILSRTCELYENGYSKWITSQLGFSFKYYGNKTEALPFKKSVVMEKSKNLFPRPNEKLVLGKRSPSIITKLSDTEYLIDMEKETVGFIDLDFESEEEQEIVISYGEFLLDGRVCRDIRSMDFSVEYVAKKGRNQYVNYFRRLAGRYLQVHAKSPIKINYIGLLPTDYPVKAVEKTFKSALRNDIYKTAVRTLFSCMHEHYEDCPWREQALYTMDSRNEMLCTYLAFGDFKFARSNLVLMSKGLRKDGLLSICYPSGRDIPIPFFSLIYSVQVYEYIEYSKDYSILDQVFDVCKTIMETFSGKIAPDGLIKNFPYPYWNFYEWSDGSNNGEQISRKPTDFYPERTDLILNCMYLFSASYYKKLCDMLNKPFDYNLNDTKEAIKSTFYDEKKGLYKASDIGEPFYTVLGNALAILCGLGGEDMADRLLADSSVVPITLSMNTFIYEALITINKDKYKKFILDDIDAKYKRMLDAGATTFWETEEGSAALAHTGSLCHGWAAMPIYYYTLLNGKEYFNGEL